jgi:hypothetical protein
MRFVVRKLGTRILFESAHRRPASPSTPADRHPAWEGSSAWPHWSTRAPRSTSKRATCQHPYPTASSSGVPPAIEAPVASISAPPSISARATSTSSLLAAQCNGVSACQLPSTEALGSAPASISVAATSGPCGKYPGQSVTACNGVPEPPLSSTRRAEARPGCSRSSTVSDPTSPAWIAATSA